MSLIAGALAAIFVVVSGPPTTPPPRVGGLIGPGPPPAWVEAGRRSVWATYGSYCWSTPGKSAVCVDMIPPTTRPDLARLRAKPGATVRLHIGFAPRSVRIYVLSGTSRRRLAAVAGRTVSWGARLGIVEVAVTGARGSASYLVRLVSAVASLSPSPSDAAGDRLVGVT